MVQLGSYLKRLREDLGFSLRRAAREAGVSPAHLCKIEQGTIFKSIGIEVIVRLAGLYNIPISGVLEEAGIVEGHSSNLPEFAHYLRYKYNLSPQAIRDLETAKEVVTKKYKTAKEGVQTSLF